MVLCYAIESYISLIDPSVSVYLAILRDCYEAYAMYCFGRYLVACLGGEVRTIEFLEREARTTSKLPLLKQHFTEMLIKALSAVAAIILKAFGVYCEGDFKVGCGYPYIAVVLNFSRSWALYCLVQFYTATKTSWNT